MRRVESQLRWEQNRALYVLGHFPKKIIGYDQLIYIFLQIFNTIGKYYYEWKCIKHEGFEIICAFPVIFLFEYQPVS